MREPRPASQNDGHAARGTPVRPASVAVLVLVGLAALGASPAPGQDAVARGKQQFMVQGCYGCHTVDRLGTPIGPDLSRIGAKYSHDTLVRWLRDPAAERATAHMPRLTLGEDEIASLAAYLSSLR